MFDDLQSFFESTVGQITTVFVMLILLLLIMIPSGGKKKKPDMKAMTVSALLIALAVILSNIKLFSMPQGGSGRVVRRLPVERLVEGECERSTITRIELAEER